MWKLQSPELQRWVAGEISNLKFPPAALQADMPAFPATKKELEIRIGGPILTPNS
jgi:hypothetical protein